ncbi:hypothetical protein ACTXT7_006048 [Hymenolepis weldensis]
MDRQRSQWETLSSNKIQLHLVKLSKSGIGWPKIFAILLLRVGRGVVEAGVSKHPHNTKSSSLMEAIAWAMKNINKDYLI